MRERECGMGMMMAWLLMDFPPPPPHFINTIFLAFSLLRAVLPLPIHLSKQSINVAVSSPARRAQSVQGPLLDSSQRKRQQLIEILARQRSTSSIHFQFLKKNIFERERTSLATLVLRIWLNEKTSRFLWTDSIIFRFVLSAIAQIRFHFWAAHTCFLFFLFFPPLLYKYGTLLIQQASLVRPNALLDKTEKYGWKE